MWECVCVCVKKRHILSYFKTYTSPDCTQALFHTSVIFTSLCYLWAWSWQWRTPEHLPLHTNKSTQGGLRKAVNYNRDIPAGNSFSKKARVGYVCVCVMGVLSGFEHDITHLTLSFSHCVARDIPFSWMALAPNTWPSRDYQLSLQQTHYPATCSISHLFYSTCIWDNSLSAHSKACVFSMLY